MTYTNLQRAIKDTLTTFEEEADRVHTERWQAVDISANPMAEMVELLHETIHAEIVSEDLEYLRQQIQPNLPWADDHFDERVCGYPINPGIQWEKWPWAHSADKHRDDEKFNHNYMERYWPKHAHKIPEPTRTPQEYHKALRMENVSNMPHFGLKGPVGDLNDLISVLAEEPGTRQAYMPIWFPEDTSKDNKGRKPCTLGYHFIMRRGQLDIRYDIRSCDLSRHFRDDIYLTVRLAIHVLQRCRLINPEVWNTVQIGKLIMNITSLHMFIGDYQALYRHNPGE